MASPWHGASFLNSSQGPPFASTSSASCFPPANAFATPSPETIEQLQRMKTLLNKKLGPEMLSNRQGGGGTKLTYIEAWRVIALANEVFGFNGWSSEIKSLEVDFVDHNAETGRYNVGVTAIVKVWLRDGCCREDIGYGKADGLKNKAEAIDKSKKEASTDALKRCLRTFGNLLGNCIYDKHFVAEVAKMKAPKPKIDFNNLHRGGDMYPTPDASTECAASAIPPPPQASTSRNPPPPQLSETPAKALPAVSKPLPPAAKPAPPARPTAQQVASRAISGPQPKAPPATTVRPDTGLISADDDALFADLDLDTDGFGGAADASSEGSELNVSFFDAPGDGPARQAMPPPPIPARSALPPTVTRSPGIDPNSSRPVRRGVGAQGVPTFHQPAATRPVVAGEAQPAARLLPSPELGGFGSARGVKREAASMGQENERSGGGQSACQGAAPRSPLAEIPLEPVKRPRVAPA